MAGEHAGHRQRMRERFLCGGLDGFADHEVLELMLFYAIPQRNVNPLAHRLLERFGTLHAVLEASVADLMKVEGVGRHTALLLNLFSHAARRLEMSREVKGEPIQTRGMAEKHAIRLLQGLKTEHFYVACLDGQMRLIADELIARGSIDEVQAYPRLVAEDSASVPHGFLVVLLMGMSAAWVHGFGFVPENHILRVLFSPVVAWPVMLIGTWGVFLR